MEKITLISTDKKETIDATMKLNDDGNTVEIIVYNDTLYVNAVDEYPFFALVKIREKLELKGYHILVNGSRYNVYPSGMQYSTFSAYELELGKQATKTVNIFDKIYNSEEIGTVEKQKEYFYRWIESLGG